MPSIVLVIVLIFVYWLYCSPFKWRGKGIEWRVPWPLFGNTAGTLTSSYFDYWIQFARNANGEKMIGFHFFTEPALFINDPELIKQIMVTEANKFNERIFASRKGDIFSTNLFSIHGEEWRVTRSKLSPFFSPARIKGMVPIIEKNMFSYLERLKSDAKKGPVDVDEVGILLAIDTIITCIFGLKPECFTNPNSFFIELQKSLPGFFFGFRNLVGILSPKLYTALGLTVFSKKSNAVIANVVKQIVEARIKGIGVRQDFMQGMIELYKNENLSTDKTELNADGTRVARFDLEKLTSQAAVMFLAGTDTTAHVLSFLLYELAKAQHIQDKLRKEILEKGNSNNGHVGYDEIQGMVYLDMNVQETLRLYPAAPFIPRRCVKPTVLDGKYIEKGIIVVTSNNVIQRDKKYYPNPEAYNPENFRPGRTRQVGSYLPFGIGPRTCIGKRLAEVEIKLAVCGVLSTFKVSCCKETPNKAVLSYGPLVGPLGGMKLKLELL